MQTLKARSAPYSSQIGKAVQSGNVEPEKREPGNSVPATTTALTAEMGLFLINFNNQ